MSDTNFNITTRKLIKWLNCPTVILVWPKMNGIKNKAERRANMRQERWEVIQGQEDEKNQCEL